MIADYMEQTPEKAENPVIQADGSLIPASTGDVFNMLSRKQEAFVHAILEGRSIIEAGQIAGYSHESGAYAASRSPVVKKALREFRDGILKSEGASVGMRTVIELAREAKSESVKLKAAERLLMIAGHITSDPASDDDPGKPIDDMNFEELQRMAARHFEATGDLVTVPIDKA